MIKTNENLFLVGLMCRLLSVSRSGYTGGNSGHLQIGRKQTSCLRLQSNGCLTTKKAGLARPGLPVGLRPKAYPQAATASPGSCGSVALGRKRPGNTRRPPTASIPWVAPNLLEQNFMADKSDQKWVSDITYSWTDEGWLYLAVVLELYSRRVIGWAIAERMTATLVCDALIMALWHRKPPTGVVVHSDRGSQCCSTAYQKLFSKHRLICSMSKKGDCYDNAAMESWNHSFKVEAVHGERFKTRPEAKYQAPSTKHQVFEYIEV